MPSTNSTSRGELNKKGTKRKRDAKPPLFASDESADEHDAKFTKREDAQVAAEEDRPRIPYVFELILPLSICVGGAVVAMIYNIQWLMILSSILAALSVIIYFINSRRRARYRSMTNEEHMQEQIADYRRDLLKTLEGYDVDRDMTESEIDALVDEYRHHLEVENASLSNVNLLGVVGALLGRKKGDAEGDAKPGRKTGRKASKRERRKAKKEKELSRGGLSDE